ncbi:MAG TPA: hypothetical protein VGL48_02995 [Acidimicrobiales bacterium]|jgi:hypothetical protein
MAVVAVSATSGGIAFAGDVTADSELAAAKAAIAKQTSVHVVFTAHAGGSSSTTEKIVADVGTTSGVETIVEGTANLEIRATPDFAYMSGNSAGLTTVFGLSSADAKKLGRHWESWKAGTKQYANLRSDLKMSSVKALLPEAKGTKLSSGPGTYVLRWTTAATSSIPKLANTLTLSAKGTNLPISKTETDSGGTKVTTTLSRWGEQVAVSPPPARSTISSSKLGG